jgi:YYY domain-containing protein
MDEMHEQLQADSPKNVIERQRFNLLPYFLLVLILAAGAYFRFTGVDWDAGQHVHPDERFLTMVVDGIRPVPLSQYFNTSVSTLNPNNVGYGFYVYGTLPLFIVRYMAGWFNMTGYGQIYLMGRILSAAADFLTVMLAFLIAMRLYRKTNLGLLVLVFEAGAVLQIQLSHFFTVDTFSNLFTYLALYFAVVVMTHPLPEQDEVLTPWTFWGWLKKAGPYVGFGLALGMAAASKVNTAPVALVLPLAIFLRLSGLWTGRWDERLRRMAMEGLLYAVLAAILSLLVFRIFQPYAFTGPGFFNVKLNPDWIADLKELRNQSTGDVDFPPALQWARRPIWFGWQNLTVWGLGLPLGLAAWASFLWMGWRIWRGEWQAHLLLWAWTGLYFLWQGTGFVSSMRYLLPIYPSLAIVAAWGLIQLWESSQQAQRRRVLRRVLSLTMLVLVVTGTTAWAFAFTRIYHRPESRVAASAWMYQNVPGPVTLEVETNDGRAVNVPLPLPAGELVASDSALRMVFRPAYAGFVTQVEPGIAMNLQGDLSTTLAVTLSEVTTEGEVEIAYGLLTDTFGYSESSAVISLDAPIAVQTDREYVLEMQTIEPGTSLRLRGSPVLVFQTTKGARRQALPEIVQTVRLDADVLLPGFRLPEGGILKQVRLNRVVDWDANTQLKTLEVVVARPGEESNPMVRLQLSSDFAAKTDPRGEGYILNVEQSVLLSADETYLLRLRLVDGDGRLAVYGVKPTVETTWDMTVPFDLGYGNPFDIWWGIYRTDLNLELYWDDNAPKTERMLGILDQADYILSSTNRVWGTVPRVPERYPVSTEFYRLLLGCPPDKDVVWCYRVAEVGTFEGQLGFDLVYVGTSYPNLGPLRFNTQFAEEAFSVYDHAKVMIFRKNASYDPERVRALLEAVDVSKAVHLTPRQAGSYKGDLRMSTQRWAQQLESGTWSELFDVQAFYNRYPFWGLVLWYVALTLLGWLVYPLVRLAMGGLPDRGYPFSKLVALLLLAWLTWIAGSIGIAVTQLTINAIVVLMILLNGALFWVQRKALIQEFTQRRGYWLRVEALFLVFFLAFVLVRLANPDLWHPYKGGEKPMDFSYFNAVLKSSTFPPYDPWYAGGYINYYYYGFVIVGMFVKWLGIVPAIAYNLILPTLFAMVCMGAFSVVWNLTWSVGRLERQTDEISSLNPSNWLEWRFYRAGLWGAGLLAIIGNLGTVRMIWHGLQRLALPAGLTMEDGTVLQRWLWSLQGLGRFISGQNLPYGWGDWYWIPSRALPGNNITEFPFFTFLYADLHAHMIALPITVLAIGWILGILLDRWQWKILPDRRWLSAVVAFFLGGLAIGALRPTNTWDLPTYLLLAVVVLGYVIVRYGNWPVVWRYEERTIGRVLMALVASGLLVGLAFVLYEPFSRWYQQGYGSIAVWKEPEQAPFWSYLTHWGIFLFILLSWLWYETLDWMAKTPLSALSKLKPYASTIGSVVGFVALVVILGVVVITLQDVTFAWLALPAAVWAGVLMLRQDQPDAKRLVLFLVGTGLVITLFVELFVLVGDINRMNTVFKFYLQAWTLFAISSAAALFWMLPGIDALWGRVSSAMWRTAFVLLVGGGLLFPLLGGADKMRDRMSSLAPHTLDGMAYMQTSFYNESGFDMDLEQDYQAIRWMQDHVVGTPVIVEGKTGEYRWGTRFTIYTGLPGVVGWNWHQIQQRNQMPSSMVTGRIEEINAFYLTVDPQQAKDFLDKYDVKYIVLGQLERAIYPGPGLDKFEALDGNLWREVFRYKDTVLYEVIE